MVDIEFLTIDDVMAIHRHEIERYGGSEGIRDMGLLLSALAMPRATFGGEYLHEDLFAMGAAYLFHIAQNHPFLDGNKRTAAATALTFLDWNGVEIDTSEDELEQMVREVATGQMDKEAVADFLRQFA